MLRTRIRGAAVAGVLCALAVAAVFPAAGSALAASPSSQAASPPDDHGLIVAERAHVDSPKVYWADGDFDLRAGVGSAVHPIANTINSLGHGYDRQGRPTFLFTVPENASELAFLGSPGETWHAAPAVSNLPHEPIWATNRARATRESSNCVRPALSDPGGEFGCRCEYCQPWQRGRSKWPWW